MQFRLENLINIDINTHSVTTVRMKYLLINTHSHGVLSIFNFVWIFIHDSKTCGEVLDKTQVLELTRMAKLLL